jgi:hypothetical protein
MRHFARSKWWLLRSTRSGHLNDNPLGSDCTKNFNCWQTIQTATLVAAFVKCGYRLACLRVCVDHAAVLFEQWLQLDIPQATASRNSVFSRRYICVCLISAVETECLCVLFRDTVSCYDYVAPWAINAYGALVECYWQGKNKVLGDKVVLVPLCTPQIPYWLVPDWKHACRWGNDKNWILYVIWVSNIEVYSVCVTTLIFNGSSLKTIFVGCTNYSSRNISG